MSPRRPLALDRRDDRSSAVTVQRAWPPLRAERMLHLRLLGAGRRLVRLDVSDAQAIRELRSITGDPRLLLLAARAAPPGCRASELLTAASALAFEDPALGAR